MNERTLLLSSMLQPDRHRLARWRGFRRRQPHRRVVLAQANDDPFRGTLPQAYFPEEHAIGIDKRGIAHGKLDRDSEHRLSVAVGPHLDKIVVASLFLERPPKHDKRLLSTRDFYSCRDEPGSG